MMSQDDFRIDLLLTIYLEALEEQKLSLLDELDALAETDAELAAGIERLEAGLLEERGLSEPEVPCTLEADAETVRNVIRLHFPEPTPPEFVTAADVAGKIRADVAAGRVRISETDREANDALVGNSVALPETLTQPAVDRFVNGIISSTSQGYRNLFRDTALPMQIASRSSRATFAAARSLTENPQSKDRSPGEENR